MAHHQRGTSEALKAPHSVSLKVLRLSKPTLTTQYPLPKQSSDEQNTIDRRAALSCSSSREDNNFFLSTLLTLPSSFGTVHVGETLLATLCVNNELPPEEEKSPMISKVQLAAEVQAPSQGEHPIPVDLSHGDVDSSSANGDLPKGATQQRLLSFSLQEEGVHVLAITVSYSETQQVEDGSNTSPMERVRTFRKLYQFTAQQLLSVRTKTRNVPFGKNPYVLEAQLENLGDDTIVLESVSMHPRKEFESKGMNAWDNGVADETTSQRRPVLRPRNILQAAFLIQPVTVPAEEAGAQGADESRNRDGRVTLGQMWIRWRGPMGTQGSLNTGWLTGKRL